MEAFALYTSASVAMGSKPEYFAIKGVADLADGKKRDDAQAFASELSAKVLKLILVETK
jgi:NADH dehydrogenase FAD-containing subunit